MPEDLKKSYDDVWRNLTPTSDIVSVQNRWSDAIDSMILSHTNARSNLAVIALGGYGRKEMSPRSDIDLLFLCHKEPEKCHDEIAAILYPMLNAGFDAGGSSRTIDDCRSMYSGDVRAQTAMLDGRFIAGNISLANDFKRLIDEKLSDKKWCRTFARQKFIEQQERFKRFGSSVFVLEPNIKEGEGGLREYHTASWVSRVMHLERAEVSPQLLEAYRFLHFIRSLLHIEQFRAEDRLTYDRQNMIADKLGISPEAFMDKYYASTALIHKETSPITELAAPILRRVGRKWRLKRIRKCIGAKPTWEKIAEQRSIIGRILFYMHDEGLLNDLIPSFSKIYRKAQFGAYHVYTVDIHSILSVKRISELESGNEHKLLKNVFKSVRRKDLLLLAALLHDIGKGTGSDHAERGAVIAKDEVLRLGFCGEDAQLVSFLVGSHLLMPKIAFSRDLNDVHLIEKFASSVGSVERLNMLFVLTYGDIDSIGPNVWNAWKEKLLGTLYLETKSYLEGRGQRRLIQRADHLKNELLRDHSSNEIAARWVRSMSDRYFASNTYSDIAGHIEMYEAFSISSELSDHADAYFRHRHFSEFSELVIMANDMPGLFAKIAGTISGNNINILEADLNSSSTGVVLDTLHLQSETGRSVSEDAIRRLEFDLGVVISDKRKVEDILARRARSLRRRAIHHAPRVDIDNDVSAYYSVIDIYANDRLGLLFDVAQVFANEGFSIDVAKILTKGDLAQDSFYLKDFDGKKIASKDKIVALQNAIMEVLK